MRQITAEACRAFEQNRIFRLSNTEVHVDTTGTRMYLWGNLIARKVGNRVQVTLAGYNTQTTRDRLNGLTGVTCTTHKGQAFINGKPVANDEWVQVSEVL